MSPGTIEEKSMRWNLWHGCHKLSAGCEHCYVYRADARHDVDSRVVRQTKAFDLPVRRKRNGDYKVPPGTCLYTCFTSDFFLDAADPWRAEAWAMIRQRADLHFMMITKRVDRLLETLPADWGAGYAHVTIGCTIENQDRANYRLPFYRAAPLARKFLVCEPLLEPIDLRPHDIGAWVEQVIVGGESGHDARPCDFSWIMALHDTCVASNVSFLFKQTGARFMKDGKSYSIARHLQHAQARKAGINFNASRPAIF